MPYACGGAHRVPLRVSQSLRLRSSLPVSTMAPDKLCAKAWISFLSCAVHSSACQSARLVACVYVRTRVSRRAS